MVLPITLDYVFGEDISIIKMSQKLSKHWNKQCLACTALSAVFEKQNELFTILK